MQTLEPNRKEEFWRKAEEKHGTVLGYGMGQYMHTTSNELVAPSLPKKKEKIWGVSYITEKGIFLYRFPHQNWIASMFNIEGQSAYWVEVFFSSVQAWRKPKKVPFLRSLFSIHDARLILCTPIQATSDASSPDTEETQDAYTVHSFIFDYQQQLLLHLAENFLSDVPLIE